jgi:hypothetical protein
MIATLALIAVVLPPWEQMRSHRIPGEHYTESLPDGRVVTTTFRGWINEAKNLPQTGNQIGDEIQVTDGDTCWIWLPLAGTPNCGWVDP